MLFMPVFSCAKAKFFLCRTSNTAIGAMSIIQYSSLTTTIEGLLNILSIFFVKSILKAISTMNESKKKDENDRNELSFPTVDTFVRIQSLLHHIFLFVQANEQVRKRCNEQYYHQGVCNYHSKAPSFILVWSKKFVQALNLLHNLRQKPDRD